jgi:nicotinate-nucleotide pyrophosphorylase (carboxylating)
VAVTSDSLLLGVKEWLAEDLGSGDATTDSLIPEDATCTANLLVKERGVVSGLGAAESVFRELDPDIRFEALAGDGELVEPGPVARVEGSARAILTGERTALNLLGRMSGIATLTRCYVDAVEGTGTVVLDTRKTTPGLRASEKAAVRAGGGTNHRFGLYDGVLIKDNHLRLSGSIADAVAAARETGLPVEVECDTLDQVRAAVEAGPDRVLLDNMSQDDLPEAVRLVDGRAETEASGGVTLDTVRAIAETGVDFISVGALTHSARSLDVSLEVL